MDDLALLDLWARASAGDRAAVLADACGGAPRGVGARNRVLLAACPDAIDCVADCPACGERLELELRPAELLSGAGPPAQTAVVELAGRPAEVRAPTAGDLEAAAAAGSVEDAYAVLLERCLGPLPEADAASAAGEALDAADPLLAPALDLTCPACAHAWPVPVDPGALLWSDLDGRARAVAGEVAALARAFGWSEADVVAVPAPRRRLYLELTG